LTSTWLDLGNFTNRFCESASIRNGQPGAPVDYSRAILASTCPHWNCNNRCVSSTLQLPFEGDLPGNRACFTFVAAVASALLGRTPGFLAVVKQHRAILRTGLLIRMTYAIDLLAIEVYAGGAALSVEAFRLVVVRWLKNRRLVRRPASPGKRRCVLPALRPNLH
jgi:hypothetical protein